MGDAEGIVGSALGDAGGIVGSAVGDVGRIVDGAGDALGGDGKGMLPGKNRLGELGGTRLLTFRSYPNYRKVSHRCRTTSVCT